VRVQLKRFDSPGEEFKTLTLRELADVRPHSFLPALWRHDPHEGVGRQNAPGSSMPGTPGASHPRWSGMGHQVEAIQVPARGRVGSTRFRR